MNWHAHLERFTRPVVHDEDIFDPEKDEWDAWEPDFADENPAEDYDPDRARWNPDDTRAGDDAQTDDHASAAARSPAAQPAPA